MVATISLELVAATLGPKFYTFAPARCHVKSISKRAQKLVRKLGPDARTDQQPIEIYFFAGAD